MKRFYSRSTGCTYLEGIHHEMPADAVPISEARYDEVIANPGTGKIREHDSDGLPFLVDPIPMGNADKAQALHAEQYAAVNRDCEAVITAGFNSSALGAPHSYSSLLDDQLNLAGAALHGTDMPYPCRDEQGVKEFRLHTASQLRQVNDDFTLYKLKHLQRANMLKQQLDQALAAADLAALAAVTWESEQ